MTITHVLPNHGSVLGFHQAVVVRVPRPRFSLLYQQLVQQLRYGVVDELASVVGMKARDAERELAQHRFQHRNQPCFADLGCRPHHLPLRHLIDRVDVVHALHCIQIALVHRVNSQVTGTALRVRPPPIANGDLHGPCLLVEDPLLAISPSFAQVVDVRYRDGREPFIPLTAVVVKLAVENFPRRRSAQDLMRFVHLGQQLDIRRRVVARKAVSPVAPLAHPPTLFVTADQTRHLRPAQSCHLADVSP